MSFEQKQVVTKYSQNNGTSGVEYVTIRSTEVINLLKDIEGIKRRLLSTLKGGN